VGKNQFHRKYYTDLQIEELLSKVNNNKSLFTEKIFNTEFKWRNDIIRHLNINSCNRFFYKLYCKNKKIPVCNNCKKQLKELDFNYRHKDRFNKYCNNCTNNKVWLYHSPSLQTIKKIKIAKKVWLETDEGKAYKIRIGKINSKKMKEYNQTEKGKEQIKRNSIKHSEYIKRRILDGTWTPNIHNYWTHWTAQIKINDTIKKFRSTWEACFWFSNQDLQYEKIRISYNNRIYISDFFDEQNRILYELKPKYRFLIEKEKMDAVINWCFENKIKFIWINEHNIMKYINELLFTNENLTQLNKLKEGIHIDVTNT
jgi:hypothetical protein